jgi:aerobic C4-dicarboxylate transport protein
MATITSAAPVARKPIYSSLFVQVLAALLLGIVLGMAVPDFAIGLKIFSDAFLKLISMIVAPIVFCVVVHGIAGAGDLKKVGRVGVKALIYFEVMTTIALVVGLLLAYAFGPGSRRCWVGARPRSLLSHSPTKSRGWPGHDGQG